MGNQICCKNKAETNNEFQTVNLFLTKVEEINDKKENNNVSTVDQSFYKQSENITLNGKAKSLYPKFNDKLNFLSLIRLQRTIRKFMFYKSIKCAAQG